MERVQGRDIFHSGDIFCKTHKKSGKSRKNKSIKCIKLADIIKYPSLLKKKKQIDLRTEKDCSLHILHAGGNYTIHHSGYAYIILTCYLG